MKKYILFGAVTGIGGWQLYIDARYTYLTDIGIEVYVFDGIKSSKQKIKLDELKNGKVKRIRELSESPQVYSKKQIISIVQSILGFINYEENDEIFIESTSITYSLWGELVAESTRGTNYCYLLHSHIENIQREVQDFFWQKYKNNLLAGMATNTLPELFSEYKDIPSSDNVWIAASWKDPLCKEKNYRTDATKIVKAHKENRLVIGYFGTLNKPHFIKLCDFMATFCGENSNYKFLFVSVGSSKDGYSETYQKQLENTCTNCGIINIEEMYPVPDDLFKQMDVCIASWGCARVAARSNRKTIMLVNDVDITPHGIMGITIKKEPYNDEPKCKESLAQLLHELLFTNKYDNVDYSEPIVQSNYYIYQKKQDFVMQPFVNKQNEYYDVRNIPLVKKRDSILKKLNKVFGLRITSFLIDYLRKVRS